MMDLHYKLDECSLVYGTVGTFVAPWFSGFFNMTRFGLGRLQFEITNTKEEYIVGGVCIPAESPAINIPLPGRALPRHAGQGRWPQGPWDRSRQG